MQPLFVELQIHGMSDREFKCLVPNEFAKKQVYFGFYVLSDPLRESTSALVETSLKAGEIKSLLEGVYTDCGILGVLSYASNEPAAEKRQSGVF